MKCVKETSNKVLHLINLLFPKAINSCITLAGFYITTFSVISQISAKQAIAYLDTKPKMEIDGEESYVEGISNDILWNCNHESKGYYQFGFAVLLGFLVVAYFFATFWSLYDDICKDFRRWILSFLSSVFLNISFILVLTTYDVSLWDCFRGPADEKYNKDTKNLDLKFNESTMKWQLYGSILSFVFLLICITLNAVPHISKYCEISKEEEKLKQRKITTIKFVDCAKNIKKVTST